MASELGPWSPAPLTPLALVSKLKGLMTDPHSQPWPVHSTHHHRGIRISVLDKESLGHEPPALPTPRGSAFQGRI